MKNREWEKSIKKDMIADSAKKLIFKKGLANVTMKEIANKIGYSKSSIYSYFDSKDDILHYLIEKAITLTDEFYTNLKNQTDEESDNLLEYIIQNEFEKIIEENSIFDLIHKNYKEFLELFSKNDLLVEKMFELRDKQIETTKEILREYVNGNDEKLLLYSSFLIDIFHSINHYKHFTEKPMNTPELKKYFKNFLFYGLKGNL